MFLELLAQEVKKQHQLRKEIRPFKKLFDNFYGIQLLVEEDEKRKDENVGLAIADPMSIHKLLAELAPESKILDLGSGLGFPSWACAVAGHHAYGVEDNKNVFNTALQIRDRLANKYSCRPPSFVNADYFTREFWKTPFDDGTLPTEMDYLYCNNVSLFHREVIKLLRDVPTTAELILMTT